ncbi:MAG TPA: ADP-ribosylglycohydrolase family protein, partial [bacterium]|nr:ADP-ribosylglycohydrolase family protein [bacterium]
MTPTRTDRAAGAILGSLIGDALSVGPHWYYDLEEQRRDYGDWISDYQPPKEGRYHYPLEAGELSQTGQITVLVLESLVERGGFDLGDLTRRFDALLATLDGTPQGGRYTDHAIRDVWKQRHRDGRPWEEVGSHAADTADSAIFLAPLAARYAGDWHEFGRLALTQTRLTHRNPIIVGNAI